MTTELDIGSIKQNGHYSVRETARLLGVNPSSLYRNYFKNLNYYYDERGRRFYSGYAIANWWQSASDPCTGKRVILKHISEESTTVETVRELYDIAVAHFIKDMGGMAVYVSSLEKQCLTAKQKHDLIQAGVRAIDRHGDEKPKSSILSVPLSDFGVSSLLYNFCMVHNIITVGDLVSHKKSEMIRFRHFGKKSFDEACSLVERLGLSFAEETEEKPTR